MYDRVTHLSDLGLMESAGKDAGPDDSRSSLGGSVRAAAIVAVATLEAGATLFDTAALVAAVVSVASASVGATVATAAEALVLLAVR